MILGDGAGAVGIQQHHQHIHPILKLCALVGLAHPLKEFGLEGEHCHIINGHVPVKVRKGESPIKGGGKPPMVKVMRLPSSFMGMQPWNRRLPLQTLYRPPLE